MTPPAPQRTTLRAPATLTGTGLFTAEDCELTIAPADPGSGIVFVHNNSEIPAHIDHLSTRPLHPAFAKLPPRCTSVGDDRVTVGTIEHIMSALTGLGVTDAHIEIKAAQPHAEVPIMDGSSLDFVRAIRAVGLKTLDAPIEPVRVRERIVVESGDASITIDPSDTPCYQYTLDYADGPLRKTTVHWDGQRDDYADHIAPARTFCMEHEAQTMHAMGLFTHLSTRDMLVIGDDGPIENQYRFDDECARHKLLDLIGDLALAGAPLLAKVTAVRSGHALAHEAARAIVAQSR